MQDFSTALLKIIEIWSGQQIYKKKRKFSQKKYVCLVILKLKRANIGATQLIFSRDRQKFQAAPLLENIPKKT
jgi:hypothetical protein